jgi:hypothetical protein
MRYSLQGTSFRPLRNAVAFEAFLLLMGLAIFPVLAVFGLVLLLLGLASGERAVKGIR